MFDIDRESGSLKRRIHRLLGSRIEFSWHRGCELDPVIGDSDWIEQVILEMAARSRASMPYGGHLAVETCNLDLDEFSAAAEALPAGRYVMVEMSCLRKTLDCFAAAEIDTVPIDLDEDLTQPQRLSAAMSILQGIGGNICEYNEPGRALTLRAFFPSAATVIYSDEEDLAVSKAELSRAILLVEDENYVREVASEILESAGYTVVAARTGKEALAVYEKNGPFLLLVTDVIMPGMNGRELSQKLTSLQPDLKTIYMSGYTDIPLFRQDIHASTRIHLQKPFTLESLTNAVREVLAAQTA